MTRVAAVTTKREPGGGELVLSRALAGSNVDAYLLGPEGRFLGDCSRLGLRIHAINSLRDLERKSRRLWPFTALARLVANGFRITPVLRSIRPDIVLANNLAAAVYALVPARISKTAFVVHVHEMFRQPSFEARVLKAVLARADRVIAVSRYVSSTLVELGVEQEKITLAYNGIDAASTFNPASVIRGRFRRELGVTSEALLMGQIGAITEEKGCTTTVEALEEIGGELEGDWRFVFIGDIPRRAHEYAQGLERRIRSSPLLGDRVTFAGWREDLPNVLSDLDLVIQPSHVPETFGLAVAEAMAMEKPVIASCTGAVPEVIRHGWNGYLVEPRDPSGLASKLLDVIHHLHETPNLRRRARQTVVDLFGFDEHSRRLREVFDSLELPLAARGEG